MIPVIFIIIFWWAGSGVVASIKAARASEPAVAATSTGSKTSQPNSAVPLAPGDITFGQWQRSLYRRWKTKTREHLPGQHLGRRAADLLGDITAAALAGATIFGLGFASGTAWAAKQRSPLGSQSKKGRTATPKNRPGPGGFRRGPRRPAPGPPPPGAAGSGSRRRATHGPNPPPRPTAASDDTVVDAELTDDIRTPTETSSRFASSEYADVVLPELTATTTAPNGHTMAAEILTIHHLLRWAQGAFEHAVNVIEQSAVRARSALDRASYALARSNTAIARRDTAVAVADTAQQHAAQLEATAARFSTLRMDPVSMTSIGVGITTAVGLAQAEQRRAEAEAEVARWSAGLAAAEQTAAECAQASARAAAVHAEAVQGMHDTVRRNQMPHAEALAATGNDAAHPSVLAAN